MLEHDYLGAEKIHERVENTLAFAATTHKVGNWAWEKIADTLILDEDMRRRLEQNNRFAAARIVDRMLEAQGRGYWQANEEKVHQLRESQSELEGWLEDEAAGRGLL